MPGLQQNARIIAGNEQTEDKRNWRDHNSKIYVEVAQPALNKNAKSETRRREDYRAERV